MKLRVWHGMVRGSGARLGFAAVLASLFAERSLSAEPAAAQARSVAMIVARGPGVAASATRGLALKLAVEAQRHGVSHIAPLGEATNALPAEDDPFFASCFSDDDCMRRLAATAGQAVLLVIIDGPADQRRARMAFVHERFNILVRRARELPAPFARSVEQEAMATLEAGLARLPDAAMASAQPPAPDAARRKTLRLWKMKCSVCHGPDGKGQTLMGQRLGLPDMGDKAWQKKLDEGKVKGWLLEGKHSSDGSDSEMASLSKGLTVEQIDALLAHVRSFGN